MKALRFAAFGGRDVLRFDDDVPEPPISSHQILVKVHAAGLNPVDAAIRSGYMKNNLPSLPATIGVDFSGEVVRVGDAVVELKVGDQVYGQAPLHNGGSGSCAQLAAAKADMAARMPRNTDFTQAAALPLAGVSAVHAIEDLIKLKAGQKILIHGGTGGIGSIAIQLAKSLGAQVATTVRLNAFNFAQDLGADVVIDYKHEAFKDQVKNYDAVLNASGNAAMTSLSFKVLKRGGILVSMRDEPDPELAKKYAVIVHKQLTQTNTRHLNRLRDLVEGGAIKVCIDTVYPLDEAQEAFRHLEEDRLRGKIVLQIPG
ncbi:MAG TPA: NADP-dependent oxidoreductase [Bacteroidota bacterium]|nr:NADP-dependent oxidoreductase [Bacteroidota bacterium]